MSTGGTEGRATGVSDRGQRSAVAYDNRGNATWTAREMAVISAPTEAVTLLDATGRPFAADLIEEAPSECVAPRILRQV